MVIIDPVGTVLYEKTCHPVPPAVPYLEMTEAEQFGALERVVDKLEVNALNSWGPSEEYTVSFDADSAYDIIISHGHYKDIISAEELASIKDTLSGTSAQSLLCQQPETLFLNKYGVAYQFVITDPNGNIIPEIICPATPSAPVTTTAAEPMLRGVSTSAG